jgi:hypothetical protein
MLKQSLLNLAAAGLIAIAVPLASAQDSSTQAPPPASDQQSAQGQGQGHGGWHHGQPDPAERTAHLTKKLHLTSDQQTKVQTILQSENTQMQSIRQNNSGSQQDRRAQMMDLHKNTDTQIRVLLDSNQQKKWDEMQAKRDQMGERHHHGGPPPDGDQPAPQPQQ